MHQSINLNVWEVLKICSVMQDSVSLGDNGCAQYICTSQRVEAKSFDCELEQAEKFGLLSSLHLKPVL